MHKPSRSGDAAPTLPYGKRLRRHQRPSTRLITGNRVTRRYKATWDGAMLLVDLTQPLGSDERRPVPDAPNASETPAVRSQEPVHAQHR